VGDGPERAGLEALAGELAIIGQVDFVGHAPDPRPFYGGFDVYALSSDTEQMPLSVLEAMASGLPVASTDVGDVSEMLAAENTPFVGPLDAAALAVRLRSLLDQPKLRAAIGAANRAKAERDYDQETMFATYRSLLVA
jgi:glycosyltransferase involved in cell wall biosynthesis